MKKIIFMLAALIAVTCSVSAQKLTKEEKAAQKAAKQAQTAALMQKIFATKSFKFVPENYEMANSARINIDTYQEAVVRPDFFHSELQGSGLIEVNRYEIIKDEVLKTGYLLTIKVEANGAQMTFSFMCNSKSGLGTLRVKSNKQNDVSYNGSFHEN